MKWMIIALLLVAIAPASAGRLNVTLTGSQVQKAITARMPGVNQRWLSMVVRTRLRSTGIYRITGAVHSGSGFVTVGGEWGRFCFSVKR